MKKILGICLFFVGLLAFAGCVVTQEYHFNKDFSGNHRIEVDMTEFLAMSQSLDSTGKGPNLDTLTAVFEDAKEKYRNLGAKNVRSGWTSEEKNTFFFSFDFDDIEHLNSIVKEGELTNDAGLYFARKGNKLQLKFPKNLSPESVKTDNFDLSTMKNFVRYSLQFSFDKEISKQNLPEARLSESKKKLIMEIPIEDLFSEKFANKKFELKLRKN